MKYVIMATASLTLFADVTLMTMMGLSSLFSQGGGLDSPGIGPAGLGSAITLGTIVIWLFKRDWDREKSSTEERKIHAETIKTMNESHAKALEAKDKASAEKDVAHAKALKEKDDAGILERKSLAEMAVAEINHIRESGQSIAETNAKAFLDSLDRQINHCMSHIDKHFELETKGGGKQGAKGVKQP